jgi:putative nucleotidyltransferase with HDIG domain
MLAAAIDEKDPYTRGHSGRVAKYSIIIAQHLGLGSTELEKIRISALLHDVGKIGVDDRVLKKPGKLTTEEFDLMKQHPLKGANIMRPVAQLKEMLPGIELHHEHVNGGGYPHGLMAERQHLDGGADLHALGALGDGGGQDQRRGQHRALGREVQLGQPHSVEAQLLGGVDLGERIGKGRRLAGARQALKLVEHAEFHRTSSSPMAEHSTAVNTVTIDCRARLTQRCQARLR